MQFKHFLNPFPDDKNFSRVQIESICRRQIKCYMKFVFQRVEIIVRKGENHSPYPTMFSRSFFLVSSKVVIV